MNRIAELRESAGLSRIELAEMLGVTPQQIGYLEKGQRKLTVPWMNKIAKALKCDPADLLAPVKRAPLPATTRELKIGQVDYIRVPVFDIRAAAGYGTLVDDEHPMAYEIFMLDQVRRYVRNGVDSLALLTVSGDSMWDTLHDGDHVLVNRAVNTIKQDGIYVIRIDDDLMIKRISRHPSTKKLTIKSDNKNYPTFENVDPDTITVAGHVVWIGRNLG